MVTQVYLGWERPFGGVMADWLAAKGEDLPRLTVLVPTSHGGRRLREALAARAGAVLGPRFATPGNWLRQAAETAAPEWVERLAWEEVLSAVTDWETYPGLFPEIPQTEEGMWQGLAGEWVTLGRTLQENGLTFASAARRLQGTPEAERWRDLARLEAGVEQCLAPYGLSSRGRLLAEGVPIPGATGDIVLAGVTDMPPLLESALRLHPATVWVCIAAPEEEREGFSDLGRPLAGWSTRPQPWPGAAAGSVTLAADARQQAGEALTRLAQAGTASNQAAIACPDPEVAEVLAETLTQAGWTAHLPAAQPPLSHLRRWLRVWSAWLQRPSTAHAADLLALPQSSALVGIRRAQKAASLAQARDRWMIRDREDLEHRMATARWRDEAEQTSARELLQTLQQLEARRGECLAGDTHAALSRLLETIAAGDADSRQEAESFLDWLDAAEPWMRRFTRRPAVWLDCMLAAVPVSPPPPPEGRVVDVLGWLELPHETGNHLILCGLNEGHLPMRAAGDPWLSEPIRAKLGLMGDQERAARDAFLFHSLLRSRENSGRVDLICGKASTTGDSLLPSRMLLTCEPDDLPRRVLLLCREVEPPEAGLRWSADWQWQPEPRKPPQRINATSLKDYLACPYRYYLRHVLDLNRPEPARVEWNARDYGTLAHLVLERWGGDPLARNSDQAPEIRDWLWQELDRAAAEWFGTRLPLAVRIQLESLRQRFAWFAETQAQHRAEGWQVVEVERKLEIPVGGHWLIAKVDRVDRHAGSGRLRVIDYKTGKVQSASAQHRARINKATRLPGHLAAADCPARHPGLSRGKPVDYLWRDLQLPLYSAIWPDPGAEMPEPAYFTLGSTRQGVAMMPWEDFDAATAASAKTCAEWIVAQIAQGVFWPPAEQVKYDSHALLDAGRSLAELASPPPPPPPPPSGA